MDAAGRVVTEQFYAELDGLIPFADPFIDNYDPSLPRTKAAQIVGGLTRDAITIATGTKLAQLAVGAKAWNSATLGQKFLLKTLWFQSLLPEGTALSRSYELASLILRMIETGGGIDTTGRILALIKEAWEGTEHPQEPSLVIEQEQGRKADSRFSPNKC